MISDPAPAIELGGAGSARHWVPFGGSVLTPALLVGEMTVRGA